MYYFVKKDIFLNVSPGVTNGDTLFCAPQTLPLS